MIFHRALKREMMHTFVGVLTALFAILLSTQLVRLLGQAASGKVAPESVVILLGFSSLGYLPVLIALSVFLSVLMALSRSYRDSEMIVWFSSGLPLTAWVRPVLQFCAPFVLAIAALSFFLAPWAISRSAEYREQVSVQNDAIQVAPGAFREASAAERIVFVENISDDALLVKNVFVSSMQQGRLGVMMAESGHQMTAPNGDQFMVLERGRRYEVVPGRPDYRMVEFDRFAFRVEIKEARSVEKSSKNQNILELLSETTSEAMGELAYRISLPLSAIVLGLLAIPLSFVNPRAGRSANLIFAILVFTLYKNLTSISQAWIAQGKLSFAVGWWLPHAVAALLLVLLFIRRIAIFSGFRRR